MKRTMLYVILGTVVAAVVVGENVAWLVRQRPLFHHLDVGATFHAKDEVLSSGTLLVHASELGVGPVADVNSAVFLSLAQGLVLGRIVLTPTGDFYVARRVQSREQLNVNFDAALGRVVSLLNLGVVFPGCQAGWEACSCAAFVAL